MQRKKLYKKKQLPRLLCKLSSKQVHNVMKLGKFPTTGKQVVRRLKYGLEVKESMVPKEDEKLLTNPKKLTDCTGDFLISFLTERGFKLDLTTLVTYRYDMKTYLQTGFQSLYSLYLTYFLGTKKVRKEEKVFLLKRDLRPLLKKNFLLFNSEEEGLNQLNLLGSRYLVRFYRTNSREKALMSPYVGKGWLYFPSLYTDTELEGSPDTLPFLISFNDERVVERYEYHFGVYPDTEKIEVNFVYRSRYYLRLPISRLISCFHKRFVLILHEFNPPTHQDLFDDLDKLEKVLLELTKLEELSNKQRKEYEVLLNLLRTTRPNETVIRLMDSLRGRTVTGEDAFGLVQQVSKGAELTLIPPVLIPLFNTERKKFLQPYSFLEEVLPRDLVGEVLEFVVPKMLENRVLEEEVV